MNLESVSRLSGNVPPPPARLAPKPAPTGSASEVTLPNNISQYQKMMEKLRNIPEVRPDKVAEAKTYLAARGPISPGDARATAGALLQDPAFLRSIPRQG